MKQTYTNSEDIFVTFSTDSTEARAYLAELSEQLRDGTISALPDDVAAQIVKRMKVTVNA